MNRVVCYWKHQCVTIVLLYGVFTVFTFSSAYAATTALVFRESFESTLSSWTIGGAPECNIVISGDGATFGTPDSPDGGKNLLVNRPANIANPAQGCNISATIPTLVSTYGTVTFWFYDNMSATNNLEMIAVVSNNTGTKTIGLGVRKMLNANEYIYRLSPDSSTSDAHYVSSGVLRSLGWHRFTFILENNTAYAELDAVSLKPKGTLVGMNNFQTIKIAAGAWAGTQPQAARFDGFIVQNNNPVVLGCSFTSPPSLLTTIMSQTSLSSFKHPGNCSGAIRAVESYQDGPNSVLVFEGDNVPVEHDRYEIEFNQNIKPVYGLGFQFGAKQVELRPDHTYTSPSGQVEEILDSNFGDGHANWDYNKGRNGYTYSADRAIMRVPVLVFPKQNILIGYYQPAVDTLRVSWETNKTTVVLKNRADGIGYHYEPYPQFGEQHGKFILIKSDSVKNLYAAYNKLLRTTTKIKEIGSGQLYFKKPHPKAFGLGWETWYEFLRTPTQPGVEAIVGNQTVSGRFSSNNLNLSHVTLGSGYWNYTDETGYNNGKVMPYMEQFQKHPTYWNNISNFVTYLKGKGIYTLLGMRFNVLDSYKDTFLQRLNATQTVKNKYFYSDIAYDGEEFSKDSYFINVLDQEVVNTHIANLQSSPAYGAFKGIKEDEMMIFDTTGFRDSLLQYRTLPCPLPASETYPHLYPFYICGKTFTKAKEDPFYVNVNDGKKIRNIPDGVLSEAYKYWSAREGGDVILWGQHDYFSVGTDIQLSNSFGGGVASDYYRIKDEIDAALQRISSGFPHVMIQDIGIASSDFNDPNRQRLANDEYLAMVKAKAFVPAPIYSIGFWNLTDASYRNASIYFMKLAERLHQYKYDHAMRWYETNIPSAMKPLFFDWPTDNNVYSLYGRHDSKANILASATDEFMAGDGLLVAPQLTDSNDVKVYLPAGDWLCFMKNCTVQSGNIVGSAGQNQIITTGTYTYKLNTPTTNLQDYPVFLRANNLVVSGNYPNNDQLTAYIAFNPSQANATSSDYWYYPVPSSLTNYETQAITKYIMQAQKQGSVVTLTIRQPNGTVAGRLTLTQSPGGYYTGNFAYFRTLSKFIGDLNGDGVINVTDVNLVKTSYAGQNFAIDDNKDNKINGFDFRPAYAMYP